MKDMPVNIPAEVTGISVCAPYHGYVVVLKEQDGKRWLPIFIGEPEAHNISLLLQGLKYIRPLTYDLFHNLLIEAEVEVVSVTVSDLRDNTFYAEVTVRLATGELRSIDARPSDAIALATKTKAPIFVNSIVLDEAGLVGEDTQIKPKIEVKLKRLKERLHEAVKQEEYEDAARIRDQIRELEDHVEQIRD